MSTPFLAILSLIAFIGVLFVIGAIKLAAVSDEFDEQVWNKAADLGGAALSAIGPDTDLVRNLIAPSHDEGNSK